MIRILDEEGHPIIGELLATLRDVGRQGDRQAFRTALFRLGGYLAYEIGRTLPTRELTLTTPLGPRTEPGLRESPVLGTILRASLPLWNGMLEVFPNSDSIILGAARKEGLVQDDGSLGIDVSYTSLVPLKDRTLIYADPMLATGSTLEALHPMITERCGRPSKVWVAAAIAYRGTLEKIANALDCDVIVASADDELNEWGYIVPGLGDAGDLAFGGKV